VGIRQLGGDPLVLTSRDMQLGRGESPADTARVLSRYVDAIMLRTDNVAKIRELAEHATVPVINGLTNVSHPCQLMADVMTFEEHRGPIAGRWSPGRATATTSRRASSRPRRASASRCASRRRRACAPRAARGLGAAGGARIELTSDPVAAMAGARCVVTDTWVSMSDEKDAAARNRHNMLAPYQLNAALLRHAAPDAIVMHCLPAHRGEEITDEVMDGPQSVVFDEAENRLHAQKGVLLWALGAG
jgi:ornithine carbamoyltransferase